MKPQSDSQPLWSLQGEEAQWTLSIQGHWSAQLRNAPPERDHPGASPLRPPSADAILAACPDSLQRLTVETHGLQSWHSAMLPALLYNLREKLEARQAELVIHSEEPSLQALMELARPDEHPPETSRPLSLLEQLGQRALDWELAISAGALSLAEFIAGLGRLCVGRARMRWRDLLDAMSESGTQALPIITLVSLLVGSILAFVGALQLRDFGAEVYIAEMVGIAVAREMAAMMTAIVMAGRTGAAFAAHLATMQVNQEVDALKTLGVSPFDFLSMPRMLALTLMMPMLYIYACVISMGGGLLVALMALGLEPAVFVQRILDGVALQHFAIGLLKSLCFGALIGLVSCHVGLASGRSAAAVGQAATRSVVISIVGIILIDSLFAIISTYTGV
ncbi:MAG: ABC transporter permease [Oleiphilaceae bacterium]|nr:ABC transporter permease [Oleiphilaceae bacterium]